MHLIVLSCDPIPTQGGISTAATMPPAPACLLMTCSRRNAGRRKEWHDRDSECLATLCAPAM